MSYKQKDFFTIELQTPSGQPLSCIEHDAAKWFVGEPGQEFQVRVNATIHSGTTYKVTDKQLVWWQVQCLKYGHGVCHELTLRVAAAHTAFAADTQGGWRGEQTATL